MGRTNKYETIRDQLVELLSPVFPGIEVSVERSRRFKRMMLTFVHPSFERWLTEQRFRFVIQRIPPEFFEKHLRGAVWFELAPGESCEEVMKAKRSEDLAGREQEILRQLEQAGFTDALRKEMGTDPPAVCTDDFARTRTVLEGLGISGDEQTNACLILISQGAYCDCEWLGQGKRG